MLEPLQVSKQHARFHRVGDRVEVEDLHSTNGVYLDGQRVQGRKPVPAGALVQIGPFVLQADAREGVRVLDTRANARLEVVGLSHDVRNRAGGGMLRLLHGIDLTIQPNEFVGLLGPSGAGKSLLMNALNGMSQPTGGRVLINDLDLYQHLNALKQSIGYVPQDDIIHRELTVYRTVYYVARLRLSQDVSPRETEAIVRESMEVTGLTERRDVPVHQLSGGQRKRVSIAVELITKPPVNLLDEPTSGLDPATEDKIMNLFREIADGGRTVILTTHAMENVKLFDKLVVLLRGRLVFFGPPQEALEFVGAESFKELYDRLEAPAAWGNAQAAAPEQIAEDWKQRFERTEQYRRLVEQPAEEGRCEQRAAKPPRTRPPSVSDQVNQWTTLVARYLCVLAGDRNNLLLLFGMVPVVALATYLPVKADRPPDFLYFVMAFAPIFFGIYASIREIIRERAVFDRERMVNLGMVPYVASKVAVLSLMVAAQCTLFFFTLALLGTAEKMKMPDVLGGVPQLGVMILTGMVGVVLGLFVSALVRTSEMAQTMLTLVVVPQLALTGLLGKPEGPALLVGALFPVTWAFDELKRTAGQTYNVAYLHRGAMRSRTL